MKKKKILLIIVWIIFALFLFAPKSYADLDEIVNYNVTVDPRMTDGTLDIVYEITWRVLDSTKEGPLTWVQIGTANENFDGLEALTDNIQRISKYNGSYVRVDFKRSYYEGEEVTFKYKLHQSYMYKLSWSKCKYDFTPAWFTDSIIDKMTVRWNAEDVKSSNSKTKEDNYLVWTRNNMSKGQKLKIKVTYPKSSFTYLNSNRQRYRYY
ncbi:MAG: hypothetical protein IJ867_03620 [Clostridia bacterium]|nr:hypothetical protein [Clostridia bacterium]